MELKEYLKGLLENINKAQEEAKNIERVKKELDDICKEFESFAPKISEADLNNVNLAETDKKRLEELSEKYKGLVKELVNLAGFKSPWNFEYI